VPLLVRTWNLFHGNAVPPERQAYLEEMVRLVAADEPDVVCLQEVPVWALEHLGAWSGMTAIGAVAARPLLFSARLGKLVTDFNHGLLRSAVTGQANAVLLRRTLSIEDQGSSTITISRRGEGERRVCQTLRLADVGFLANVHVTTELAADQFLRVATLVEELAPADEPVILCGDMNVRPGESRAYEELAEWGYSEPTPGIDQILVRGLPATPLSVWPEERRRVDGRLLSDHAPVELHVG
jgi:endonuclease/exonuclease/phosphatase family metal-dependent hydrolase